MDANTWFGLIAFFVIVMGVVWYIRNNNKSKRGGASSGDRPKPPSQPSV